MHRRKRTRLAAAAAMLAVVLAGSGIAQSAAPRAPAKTSSAAADDWVASWGSAAMAPSSWWSDYGYVTGGFEQQTLRQVVHSTVAGSAARITVSNAFGTRPLRIDAATVAVSLDADGSSPGVQPDSLERITFHGSAGTSIPAGDVAVSDPVDLAVPADHDVAVSLYLPAATGPPNGHLWAAETSHVGPGNLVDDAAGASFTGTTISSYHVTAVDVLGKDSGGSVVVLGDSFSDGILAVGPDREERWSDRVFDRLQESGRNLGVVSVAVAGNALLPASDPNSALARLDRDVLSRAGVTTMIMLLGTNDIGAGRSADEIIDGLELVIRRARKAGIRVVGATIPPIAGPADGSCPIGAPVDPERESIRQAVNDRIRSGNATSLPFDDVVDFDAALRNPDDPTRIQCAYSFNRTAHPNTAGHRALGDAVDLGALGARG